MGVGLGRSLRGAVAVGMLVIASGCGTDSLAGATPELASEALSSCPWDPIFGSYQCTQTERRVEFSVQDTTVASMKVEITTSSGTRTLSLGTRTVLDGGYVKFTGYTNKVRAGTLVRILVARASGQTATSTWFGYLRGTPAVECAAPACVPSCAANACGVSNGCGGTCGPCASGQSCVNNQCACVPSCGANTCGGDGCGGTCGTCASGTSCQGGQCVVTGSCVAPWSPSWSVLPSAAEWWTELRVAGGGVLTTSVSVQNVATGAIHPLSYAWGRWAGGVVNLTAGTQVVLRATNALGATARTVPFRYLIDAAPLTDPCGGTAATNTTCAPLSRGLVTFTLDDSGTSQPAIAIPLMQRYGVKGTFFVVPAWHSWTTLAQQLATEGHEFGDHSMTHVTLTGLSAQQLDDELRLSKAWIETNFHTTVESFATPSAAWDDTVIAAAKRYFTSHRTGNADLNFVGNDVFKLQSDFVLNTTTAQSICARMQEAAAQKGWLLLTFHDFTTAASASDGFTLPAAAFEAMLTCATTTPGLDVVTTRQAVAKLRCGSPP